MNGKRLKRFMCVQAHREKTQSSCRECQRSIGLLKSRDKTREKSKSTVHCCESKGKPDKHFVVLLLRLKIYWQHSLQYSPTITLITQPTSPDPKTSQNIIIITLLSAQSK